MRGDAARPARWSCSGLFQSAPRTFMRGDVSLLQDAIRKLSFNPRPALSCGATLTALHIDCLRTVSIRAPHFHAGRPGSGLVPTDCVGVSIRAPHFHAGRRVCSDAHARDGSFNPRPALSCGATAAPPTYCKIVSFQSAPRTFMRGDAQSWVKQPLTWGFNPRPALSCGATSFLRREDRHR